MVYFVLGLNSRPLDAIVVYDVSFEFMYMVLCSLY